MSPEERQWNFAWSLVLEEPCDLCGGKVVIDPIGIITPNDWNACEKCEGLGMVPTQVGLAVLNLVARHYRRQASWRKFPMNEAKENG